MADIQFSEAVLDRAQKLLALSLAGGTEAEAQAAAKKLQELCFKYNLDVARLEASSRQTKAYLQQMVDVGAKTGWIAEWRISLVHVIAKYNFCRALTWRKTSLVSLLGREVNITLTVELYKYLSSAINRLRLESYRDWEKESNQRGHFPTEYEKRIWMSSYCKGAVYRLSQRLEEQWRQDMANANQESALIIVEQDELDDAFAQAFPGASSKMTKRKINLEAHTRGFIDGGGISLNKQMKDGEHEPRKQGIG